MNIKIRERLGDYMLPIIALSLLLAMTAAALLWWHFGGSTPKDYLTTTSSLPNSSKSVSNSCRIAMDKEYQLEKPLDDQLDQIKAQINDLGKQLNSYAVIGETVGLDVLANRAGEPYPDEVKSLDATYMQIDDHIQVLQSQYACQ